MAIRAQVALSTMMVDSMNEEEKRESALKICQLVSTTINLPEMTEERRLATIAFRNLKVKDEQVLKTLLLLLQDEDSNVRLESGKSMTVLLFKWTGKD